MSASSGFTLVEILLVLAVVGMLAALALPAYESHMLRAGRHEAQQELMEVAAEQERYRSRNGSYVADALPLQAPVSASRRRLTRNGRYEIEVQSCSGQSLASCFIATARARGNQAGDECLELSLGSNGVRGAGGKEVETCWR